MKDIEELINLLKICKAKTKKIRKDNYYNKPFRKDLKRFLLDIKYINTTLLEEQANQSTDSSDSETSEYSINSVTSSGTHYC